MRVVKKEVKIDDSKKILYYEQFQDFCEYQKIVQRIQGHFRSFNLSP